MADNDDKLIFGIGFDINDIKKLKKTLQKEFTNFKPISKIFNRKAFRSGGGKGDLSWLRKVTNEAVQNKTFKFNRSKTKKELDWLAGTIEKSLKNISLGNIKANVKPTVKPVSGIGKGGDKDSHKKQTRDDKKHDSTSKAEEKKQRAEIADRLKQHRKQMSVNAQLERIQRAEEKKKKASEKSARKAEEKARETEEKARKAEETAEKSARQAQEKKQRAEIADRLKQHRKQMSANAQLERIQRAEEKKRKATEEKARKAEEKKQRAEIADRLKQHRKQMSANAQLGRIQRAEERQQRARNAGRISEVQRAYLERNLMTSFQRYEPYLGMGTRGLRSAQGYNNLRRLYGNAEEGFQRVSNVNGQFGQRWEDHHLYNRIRNATTREDYIRLQRELKELSNETRLASRAQRQNARDLRDANTATRRFTTSLGQYLGGFVTAFAAEAFVSGSVRNMKEQEGFDAAYQAIFDGNFDKGQVELDFIAKQADRIGVGFVEAARGHKNLLANLRNKVGVEKTRELSTAILEVSRVLNLSADDTKGTIRAFSQMASKGKVQAEELRQQLAERMPFAVELFSRALGVTTQELDKMLERGQVFFDEETITAVVRELDKFAKGGLALAMTKISAAIARADNAINSRDGMFAMIADGGFREAAVRFLNNFSDETLNSADAFQTLGMVMGNFTDLLTKLTSVAYNFFKVTMQAVEGFNDTFGEMSKVIAGLLIGFAAFKTFGKMLSFITGRGRRRGMDGEDVRETVNDLNRNPRGGSVASILGGLQENMQNGGFKGLIFGLFSLVTPFTKIALALGAGAVAANEITQAFRSEIDERKREGVVDKASNFVKKTLFGYSDEEIAQDRLDRARRDANLALGTAENKIKDAQRVRDAVLYQIARDKKEGKEIHPDLIESDRLSRENLAAAKANLETVTAQTRAALANIQGLVAAASLKENQLLDMQLGVIDLVNKQQSLGGMALPTSVLENAQSYYDGLIMKLEKKVDQFGNATLGIRQSTIQTQDPQIVLNINGNFVDVIKGDNGVYQVDDLSSILN